MDYYGIADQGALPGALARLYAMRDPLLRPGMSYRILPNGAVYDIRPRDGPRMVFDVAAPGGSAPPRAVSRPGAHLPFGFKPAQSHDGHTGPLSFFTTDEPVRGIPTPASHVISRPMRPCRDLLPYGKFVGRGAGVFMGEIVRSARSCEDRACMNALLRLPPLGRELVCGSDSGMTDICMFVNGALNPDHMAFMRFDTVFIGTGLRARLGMDGVATEPGRHAPNVIEHLGMRVLVHRSIPDDVAYVVSNSHGPVFVNGPTDLACTDDGFLVERYCEVVDPRPFRRGERPRGFCVNVRRAA